MTVQSRNRGTDASSAGSPGVAGVGMTRFAGEDDRDIDELLAVAAERALDDARVDATNVESIHVGNMAAEAFNARSGLANELAANLGVSGAEARRIENTSATGASAFQDAVDAVRSGRSEIALIVAGERMSAADTATSTEIISRITHAREYEQGLTLPSFGGLAADRYLRETDADREALAEIAVKNHRNAQYNEYAQFQKSVTVDDVVESPPVAEPLRLYDCCPTSDGAAAAVLTTEPRSVTVAACEGSVGVHAIADRPDPLSVDSIEAAGEAAYDAAGIEPDDVDFACLHDAFSILEWLEMEALGFAEPGEAWRDTVAGRTDVDGEFPVNPGGGLKARGHPLAATGMSQIVELVWQLRGDVPAERAVGDAGYGLAINLAGFGNNSVCTILEGER